MHTYLLPSLPPASIYYVCRYRAEYRYILHSHLGNATIKKSSWYTYIPTYLPIYLRIYAIIQRYDLDLNCGVKGLNVARPKQTIYIHTSPSISPIYLGYQSWSWTWSREIEIFQKRNGRGCYIHRFSCLGCPPPFSLIPPPSIPVGFKIQPCDPWFSVLRMEIDGWLVMMMMIWWWPHHWKREGEERVSTFIDEDVEV